MHVCRCATCLVLRILTATRSSSCCAGSGSHAGRAARTSPRETAGETTPAAAAPPTDMTMPQPGEPASARLAVPQQVRQQRISTAVFQTKLRVYAWRDQAAYVQTASAAVHGMNGGPGFGAACCSSQRGASEDVSMGQADMRNISSQPQHSTDQNRCCCAVLQGCPEPAFLSVQA